MNSKHAMWLTIIVAVAMMPCAALASTVKGLNCPGGVYDRASTGGAGSLRIDNQLTLEAWVYPTAWRSYLGSEKHSLKIIGKGLVSAYTADWGMILSENGKLTYGSKYGGLMTANPVVPLNQWTHVAVSVNEVTGSCRLFVNGSEITALVPAGTHYPYNSIQPSSFPVGIGGFDQCDWPYNNDNFIGRLADVRVWNVERTPAQIAAKRNETLSGNEAGLAGYWFGGDNGLTDASGNGNNLTLVGAATIVDASIAGLSAGGISVKFITPPDGTIYAAPATIPISLTAAQTSTVTSIQILEGGTNLIGSGTSSNFTGSWPGVPGGSYTLVALVSNDIGKSGSASVDICVRGPYAAGTPAPIPGTVQIENYDYGMDGVSYHDTTEGNTPADYRTDDVDIKANATSANGHHVGFTAAGEWLEYTVNVLTAGTYEVETRVACLGGGGTFHIEFDNIDKTGTQTVPNTGGWVTWQTVTVTGVVLSVGQQVMRLELDSIGTSGYVGNLDEIELTLIAKSPPPTYGGIPWDIPGSVECEDYDTDGAGQAYSDTTAGNAIGDYRSDDVDIKANATSSGGNHVGFTAAGEWLEYTVNVLTSGTYDVEVIVACSGGGGTFHIEFDDVDVTGTQTVPDTGGWITWQTVTVTGIVLTAGEQTMRLELDSIGSSGFVGNLDRIQLAMSGGGGPPPAQAPYGGTSCALPGSVECEDYDTGGDGVAYSDSTAGNIVGDYRTDDVDIKANVTSIGGNHVGFTAAGEWLEYTVDVASSGTYDLEVRVACGGGGGTFHIEFDDVDKTGTRTVPNTGGWITWQTVTISGVSLSGGQQVVRLELDSIGSSGFVGNFDRITLVGQSPYGGSAPAVPGTVECEDYDLGGSGVAYSDTTSGNIIGDYRTDDVDIKANGTSSGENHVGFTAAGEWLEYTVDVTGGTYDVVVRVACKGGGGTFRILMNGSDVTGTRLVPNTGGWITWQDVTITGVSMTTGQQVMRLQLDSVGSSGFVGNFDRILISGGPTALPENDKDIQVAAGPIPEKVLTGDDVEGEESPGWLAADGDEETAWTGTADAGGWWIVLAYSEEVTADGVELLLADGSLAEAQMLGSLDADEWYDLGEVLDADLPGVFNYLWLIFADDESGAVPEVREILVY